MFEGQFENKLIEYGPPGPRRASREGPTAFTMAHESSRALLGPMFGHVAQKCEGFSPIGDFAHRSILIYCFSPGQSDCAPAIDVLGQGHAKQSCPATVRFRAIGRASRLRELWGGGGGPCGRRRREGRIRRDRLERASRMDTFLNFQ